MHKENQTTFKNLISLQLHRTIVGTIQKLFID